MLPITARSPETHARTAPDFEFVLARTFFEKPSARITGSIPKVEPICVAVGESWSPSALARMAQMPQKKSARKVQMSQRGIIRSLFVGIDVRRFLTRSFSRRAKKRLESPHVDSYEVLFS